MLRALSGSGIHWQGRISTAHSSYLLPFPTRGTVGVAFESESRNSDLRPVSLPAQASQVSAPQGSHGTWYVLQLSRLLSVPQLCVYVSSRLRLLRVDTVFFTSVFSVPSWVWQRVGTHRRLTGWQRREQARQGARAMPFLLVSRTLVRHRAARP